MYYRVITLTTDFVYLMLAVMFWVIVNDHKLTRKEFIYNSKLVPLLPPQGSPAFTRDLGSSNLRHYREILR